jgi:adenine nucleotide transporter 17
MSDRLQVDPVAHSVAAGIGGALSMAVTYPLVTLSTLAQTKSKKTVDESSDQAETEKKETVSTLTAAKYLLKNEGIFGFYSGLESAIYGVVLNNLVYYYFYEALAKLILNRKAKSKQALTSLESIITGAIAGSVTVFSTNPIWVANTRITVSGNNKMTTLGALRDIIRKDGFKTLFAGVLPALILVLNPIIQYTIFEQVKNLINKKRKGGLTSTHAFFIGALGKLAATGSTYPYITLKARMHLKDESGHKPKTIWGWMKEIYKNEGVQGFYNGIGVKLSQSVLTAAFLFFFKEELTTLSAKLLKLARQKRLCA